MSINLNELNDFQRHFFNERFTSAIYTKNIQHSDTVIDVGANIGEH